MYRLPPRPSPSARRKAPTWNLRFPSSTKVPRHTRAISSLTPETMGLIDGRRLAAMKSIAFLVNLARGPIAEEQALYRALHDRVIGGAALDTWWRYQSADDPAPRPSRYPFHELPNVIMTPHCSPRTDGTIQRRSRDVARNIDRFVRGEPLENVVAKT